MISLVLYVSGKLTVGRPMFWFIIVIRSFWVGIIVHPLAEMITELKPSDLSKVNKLMAVIPVSVVTVLKVNQSKRLHSILSNC